MAGLVSTALEKTYQNCSNKSGLVSTTLKQISGKSPKKIDPSNDPSDTDGYAPSVSSLCF